MKILITTIPHDTQRYPTAGDWFSDYQHSCPVCSTCVCSPSRDEEVCPKCSQPMNYEERIHIHVSQLPDWRLAALVAVHELIEVLLCKQAGITVDQVDAFDIEFEKARAAGTIPNYCEPGDDPAAPYQKQHAIATGVERIVAAELGVKWQEYEKALEAL